ncbi:hypothetical protein AT959_14835, partial [Dechloromonas denitrificans]
GAEMAYPPPGEGGNRWASTHAMRRVIRDALEVSLMDYEIRRYFKMGPGEEITPAKRRRMARHKAGHVYLSMVRQMALATTRPGGLEITGFAAFEAPYLTAPDSNLVPHGLLYPIGDQGELVSRAELVERRQELEHLDGNYRGGALPYELGAVQRLGWISFGSTNDANALGYLSPGPGADNGAGVYAPGREGFFGVVVQNIGVHSVFVGGELKTKREVMMFRNVVTNGMGGFVVVRGRRYGPDAELLEVTDVLPQGYFFGGGPLDDKSVYATVGTWSAIEKRVPPKLSDTLTDLANAPVEAFRLGFPRRDWVYMKVGQYIPGGEYVAEVSWMTSREWWEIYGERAHEFARYGFQIPPQPKPFKKRRKVSVRFDKAFVAEVNLPAGQTGDYP